MNRTGHQHQSLLGVAWGMQISTRFDGGLPGARRQRKPGAGQSQKLFVRQALLLMADKKHRQSTKKMAAEENASVEAGIGDVEAGAEIGEKNVPGQVPGWPKPQRITGPRLERQLALGKGAVSSYS